MMISLKKHKLGFTIVELLIVIMVVGILTLLVVTTYSGIQAKTRNVRRQNDISSLEAQLEAFFSQNGYYPSLTNMNNSSWLSANMKTLNQSALIDPSNPTQSKKLAANPMSKIYAYHVTDGSGNSCESDDTTCAQYTLTATYEGTVNGETTYSKSSLE